MGTARSGVGFVFAEGPSGESWYGSHGHRGHMDHVGCQFAVVRQGIHQAGSPGIELLVLSPVCLCLNSVAFTCDTVCTGSGQNARLGIHRGLDISRKVSRD